MLPGQQDTLGPLSPGQTQKLNAAITAGEVQYVHGEAVTEPLREALVTEDAHVVYPVIDDIPILLEEKGIGTTQLRDF